MSGQEAQAESGEAQETVPLIGVLVPSPIGPVGCRFRHTAIIQVVIAPKASVRRDFHPLGEYEDSEFLDEVFGRIAEYLAGARRQLELEYDLRFADLDTFSRRVLKETARTPYARTRTYKEIAESAGRPDAYRQVMAILERNPLPLLIPCHRIVPSKSGIGKWVAGSARKKWLLKMEKESVPFFS